MVLGIKEERRSQRPADFTESPLDRITPMEILIMQVVFRHHLSGLIRLDIELETREIPGLNEKSRFMADG